MNHTRVAPSSASSAYYADRRGDPDPHPTEPKAGFKPELSAELVKRFLALIDEVAEQLMAGGLVDERVCRADAIALLTESVRHMDGFADDPEPESPLAYFLEAERQKADAVLRLGVQAGSVIGLVLV